MVMSLDSTLILVIGGNQVANICPDVATDCLEFVIHLVLWFGMIACHGFI